MKVLHITNAYPTLKNPAFGIFIKEQIDSLTKLGITNDVFFINSKENSKLEYLKSFFKLRRLSENYDIVHCHHVYSAVVAICALRRSVKVVSFLGSGSTDALTLPKFISNIVYKLVFKKTSSRIFKNGLTEKTKGIRGNYYLPNGVNIDFFSPIEKFAAKKKLDLDNNKRYILFVSAMNLYRKEKRYDIYKKVIELLKSKYSFATIEELHLVNVSRDLVPYYFNASDLHLLVSDFEGSPNSIKESLACDVPVVSTKVGNVEEMLSGLEFNFCVNSNNPDEIAQVVSQVLAINFKPSYLRDIVVSKKLDNLSIALQLSDIYKKTLSVI